MIEIQKIFLKITEQKSTQILKIFVWVRSADFFGFKI